MTVQLLRIQHRRGNMSCVPQSRGRHYPSIPNRMEMGRVLRGAERGGPRRLRLMHGADGTVRMGFEPRGRGGGIRLVMAGERGARRGSGAGSEPGAGSEASDRSPSPGNGESAGCPDRPVYLTHKA